MFGTIIRILLYNSYCTPYHTAINLCYTGRCAVARIINLYRSNTTVSYVSRSAVADYRPSWKNCHRRYRIIIKKKKKSLNYKLLSNVFNVSHNFKFNLYLIYLLFKFYCNSISYPLWNIIWEIVQLLRIHGMPIELVSLIYCLLISFYYRFRKFSLNYYFIYIYRNCCYSK